MKRIFLGLGDIGATKSTGQELKTFALGSCVAIILLDPKTRCIAMVHVVLPDSTIDPQRAEITPGHFVDTAIPALLVEMDKLGSNGKAKGVIVKLVGGANITDSKGAFNIGAKNVSAIKKELWKYGMGSLSEDVGGRISRSVSVNVETGIVQISSPGRDKWEI